MNLIRQINKETPKLSISYIEAEENETVIHHLFFGNGYRVGELVIPEGIKAIERGTFYGDIYYHTIHFPKSLVSKGENMIYAKIYLDKNKGRKDMLVFEATQTKSIYCQISWHISIAGAKYIAISPEAKSLFRARLEDMSSFDVKKYDGDFEMFDRDGGVFVFRPNEHGQMRRELLADERFTLCAEHGFAPQILDYMVPCDNDTLKSLDITTPIDETPMLEAYYTAKRALGEELGCDPDTISRTPFKFLTEEQKQRIKKEYHTDCDHFDSCDWHYHGDFIYDKIICGLMERFHKNYAEIELMIK